MLKKNPKNSGQKELFRPRLEEFIDMRDAWVKLSDVIDWDSLEADLSKYYCVETGRPGGSIRLMVGLCIIKDKTGLSNEELCSEWRMNPYFQYFCGEEFFSHEEPVRPPSISIFRGRIKEEGHEIILAETIKAGIKTGVISKKDLEQVTVDTTVQEKAVKFPTDAELCHKARKELVKLSKELGIPLRQSYTRKGKQALQNVHKYMAARQINRGKAQIKKCRNYLGRVMRDIKRAVARDPLLQLMFKDEMEKAEIIYNQTLNPKSKEKLYSWHAPEVECIGKGKAHKRYEFGCKASYVVTNKSNFIIGAMALHGKPYDGHTLSMALEQTCKLTGVKPKEAHIDLGYRGHDIEEDDTQIILARQKRGVTKAIRKRQKRRSAIEPIIGHCKNDRKVGARNWLKGEMGDKINAIAMAIGFNIRKILKKIFLYLFQICKFIQNSSEFIKEILILIKQNRKTKIYSIKFALFYG